MDSDPVPSLQNVRSWREEVIKTEKSTKRHVDGNTGQNNE